MVLTIKVDEDAWNQRFDLRASCRYVRVRKINEDARRRCDTEDEVNNYSTGTLRTVRYGTVQVASSYSTVRYIPVA